MLLTRVAIAVAHGAYFGVAMVVAVGLVREEQRGMAVALILAGLTVSGIIGVPAGTAIGNVWGWRATFWAMFVLGIVATIAMIAAAAAHAPAPRPSPPGFRSEVRVLGRQQVWTSLILMLMLMIGQFVPYTYIAPLLQEVTGLDAGLVPWVLLLNGIGATLGVFIGGKLAGPAADAVADHHAGAAGGWCWRSSMPSAPTRCRWWRRSPSGAASTSPSARRSRPASSAGPPTRPIWRPRSSRPASTSASHWRPSIGATMLNAGFGYRSLPLLGIAAMIVAAIVAVASYAWEKRSGVTPPLPAGSPQQA